MAVWRTCHHAGVGSFLLVVVAAIVLSGIVFGAAAFTLGRDRGLTPARPDGVPFDLPADRPLERADVQDLRLDIAIRGYRMEQVDEILQRVADDFDFLHARIIDLEDQVYGRRSDEDGDEGEERPFEFPWDAENPQASTDAPALTEPEASAVAAEPVAVDAVEVGPVAAEPAEVEPAGVEPIAAEGSDGARAGAARAGAEVTGSAEAEVAEERPEVAGRRSGRGR